MPISIEEFYAGFVLICVFATVPPLLDNGTNRKQDF